jgi:uncharacterized protein YecA (UPF0149 family)
VPKQAHSDEELLAVILKALHEINMENAVHAEPCHSLEGQLRSRTAEQLRKLAKLFHVSGYSRMNKTALSQAMAERMTEPELARLMLSVTERHSWELFKAAAVVDRYRDERLTPDLYYGLQNIGLAQLYAHEGEVSVVVPDELKQAFAELKREGFVKEKDHKVLLLAYAEAAVCLYGVISQDDFVALFNRQNRRKTDVDEMFQVLIQYVDEDSVFCFWEDYLVNAALEDDDFKTVELYARHGKDKPRYVPPQEELLAYEDPGYYEETPQIEALRDYLNEFVFDDEEEAEDFVDDVYYACAMQIPGQPLTSEFRGVIEKHGLMNKQQTTDVLQMMMDVNNHARCWVNNGFTPSELAQEYGLPASRPFHKKTGPNDPCPCGSGKKYKKCCMFE